MSIFKGAHARMNFILSERLNDGTGTFTGSDGTTRTGLRLIIDSSFEMAGVLETLTGNIKAVSVAKTQMADAVPVRGDYFELCGKRYLIEDTLSDDQHFPVFACQELT